MVFLKCRLFYTIKCLHGNGKSIQTCSRDNDIRSKSKLFTAKPPKLSFSLVNNPPIPNFDSKTRWTSVLLELFYGAVSLTPLSMYVATTYNLNPYKYI